MSEPQTQWVYRFDAPTPFDGDENQARSLLGGKGQSLRCMTQAGFHVPPGFTITAACCAEYYRLGKRWPDGLEDQVRAALQHLETDTRRVFGMTNRPLLVSVRSGAAVSMPGMMDTLLNCGLHPALADDVGDTPAFWTLMIQFIEMFTKTVHGTKLAPPHDVAPSRAVAAELLKAYAAQTGTAFPSTPWDALAACINAVFDSWENERAVTYRRRHDIRNLLGTAVNVQMMFPSEVSGIVFSKDPTSPNADRMVIEASFGLGEAVVSGDVTPDRFIVDRETLVVTEKVLGQKHAVVSALGDARARDPAEFSLSPEQVRELADLSMKIEHYFHHPSDIEFGFAEGKFALLQSRKIRGLETAEDVERAREEEISRLRELACGSGADGKFWVTHNLGETLRYPTPLTWDIVRAFMTGAGGFGRMYRMLGYHPSPVVDREGFLELIGGRIFADPDRLAELFWSGMPLRYDMDKVMADRQALDMAPTKLVPEKADNDFLIHLPRVAWSMMRAGSITKRLRAHAKQRFESEVLPPYLEYVRAQRAMDLTALSDAEVIAELHERRRAVLDAFAPESLLPGYFGGIAFAALEELLVKIMGEDEGRTTAMTLTRALEGDTTFEQDAMLYKVAGGKATLAEFLAQFGHRAVSEMELSEPRWREDPSYIERMIGNIRKSKGKTPMQIHADNHHARKQAERELPKRLAAWGGSSMREVVEDHLRDAQALLAYREAGKHYLMMGYELIRLAIEELGRRWDIGRGVYYLKLDELEGYTRDREKFDALIQRRQIRRQAFQRLDVPDVIDSRHLDDFGKPRQMAAANELHCVPVAAGIAEGPAAIVFNPAEALDLESGYVLVCPSTDPGWTPLFVNASALVVERGGVLSHGAIVARDFGIPAVVCENATRQITAGRRVKIDGNTGKIIFLEP